ncbi:MAG: hypothetical protein ACTSSL_08575 [Candidatus Heimdallarchaeaceae archaeon]
MSNETKYKVGSIYFAIFGLIVLAAGVVELLLGVTGKSLEWSIMEISGEFLIWRGLILFCSGAFFLFSIKNFSDIHQQAKTVMASVMLWLIAGMKIFSMILESIPGGEEGGWFNSAKGFLDTYSPPYIPSLLLFPFSLVVIFFIKTLEVSEEKINMSENTHRQLKVGEKYE